MTNLNTTFDWFIINLSLLGASSGIGAATANQLAVDGAHLILTGRNEKNLAQVAEKCYDEAWNKPKMILGAYSQAKKPSIVYYIAHILKWLQEIWMMKKMSRGL